MKHLINNQFLAAQKAIINAKKIAIFMHENPDGDALGSSFGLFEFLKKLFPKKEIYVVCDIEHMQPHLARVFNVTKKFHIPSHDTLAIICDTSNMIRVYGENEQKKKYYTLCDSVIRFDHHPITDKIAKIDIIDNHVSSTCELVYTFLSFWNKNIITEKCATYLYIGLVTDTGKFSYGISSKTFLVANELLGFNINYEKIYQQLFSTSINEYGLETYLRTKIKFDNNFATLLIPKNIFNRYRLVANSMVHIMSRLDGIKIWTSIYYDETKKNWKGSIRSISQYDVSKIAKKYHGGGHKNASGYYLTSKKQFPLVIQDIKNLLK